MTQTVTVTVPFSIRKRGGRKLVITPDGTTAAPTQRARVDSALLKALARGFRWRKLLDSGDFATIEEIADAENINSSYVSRILRTTLLAPEIVKAILAGRQPAGLTMARALEPFPVEWEQQKSVLGQYLGEVHHHGMPKTQGDLVRDGPVRESGAFPSTRRADSTEEGVDDLR